MNCVKLNIDSQWLLALCLLMAGTSTAARDRLSPDDWLERMSTAVSTIDYEGTVIRRRTTFDLEGTASDNVGRSSAPWSITMPAPSTG